MFIPGPVDHCHVAENGALPMAKAFSRINREIKARPLESPSSVAKEVISTEFSQDVLDHVARAKLIRRAHYHRRSLQPKSLSPVDVKVTLLFLFRFYLCSIHLSYRNTGLSSNHHTLSLNSSTYFLLHHKLP